MKTKRLTALCALALALVVGCGKEDKPQANIKPYTLDLCATCGMKLSEGGKPYVFVYQDREIKLCDKDEKADFDKDPAKYIKIIETAEAKAKK